jgi:glycosyltransferase involved in cell wall biosynthesis
MTRPLRILLATDAVGGMWIYSLELAHALMRIGVEAVLAVMGPSPSGQQRNRAAGLRLIDTGLPLDWMPVSPGELREAAGEIARLAHREDVDAIQVGSAAVLAGTRFERPTIAVQHSCVASWWAAVRGTPLPPEFEWRRALVEEGLHAADAVVAPTAAFAADTERLYPLARPVAPVHNGRRPPVAPVIGQADFVFTASRLWDQGKNVATLDAAAERLGVPFEAAGPCEGPNGAAAEFANLALVGELSEAKMASVLAARPVFASSALYEPFGLSVLEAAHAGCALVLSDTPTFRELWGDVACFVPARDDRGFAETIRLLLEDREMRNALGRAAQARARHYSPEAMAGKMAKLYDGLCGHRIRNDMLAGAA